MASFATSFGDVVYVLFSKKHACACANISFVSMDSPSDDRSTERPLDDVVVAECCRWSKRPAESWKRRQASLMGESSAAVAWPLMDVARRE